MTWAQSVYRWLIWLFVLGIGVEFLLAGRVERAPNVPGARIKRRP